MQILRESIALRPLTDGWRAAGRTIALVPTMGALHQGHLDLVTAAKAMADAVIATIFVNPLQFNDPGDLARYPRTEEEDIAKLTEAGCDALWLGHVDDLYPQGFATRIHVGAIGDDWEGAHRPGHFDGVATIVAKLLIAAAPDVALFGEKDWQQLALIRRMAEDLGLRVAIHGYPTVREGDGLAMSSRNRLLSETERAAAPALKAALDEAAAIIVGGGAVAAALAGAEEALRAAGFGPIDYVAYVDGASLAPLDAYRPGGRLIAAAMLGRTRLIDNICVKSDTL